MPNKPRSRAHYLRMGLYDPDPDSNEIDLFSDAREDTEENRKLFASAIADWNKWAADETDVFLCIAIFAVKRSRTTAWNPA